MDPYARNRFNRTIRSINRFEFYSGHCITGTFIRSGKVSADRRMSCTCRPMINITYQNWYHMIIIMYNTLFLYKTRGALVEIVRRFGQLQSAKYLVVSMENRQQWKRDREIFNSSSPRVFIYFFLQLRLLKVRGQTVFVFIVVGNFF